MISVMSLIEALTRLEPAERRFGAGEHLFHQGDRVAVLHLLVAGSARLVRHQLDGATLVLQRAGPGTILAEASIFSDRYHCDALAATPVRSLAVRKSSIRARIASEPDFAMAFVAHLAREVQASRLRAEILSLRTVAARLDAWIAAHDGRPPARGEWKAVAGEIGTSAEALYREIARRRGPAASGLRRR
ncbi:MAG: Crp/Fnr family transcriptional regulator [Alphaproteobacteria bacterium]|nr:Crp/Fnr family transcriptional regulator [Alphaproteobacteria bacterium]MCW5741271.1 Crp/Fnr family transcriptional regulator [Alphaproteobacteria bacterium]